MKFQLRLFILSLLMPGAGYLRLGQKRKFYLTFGLFHVILWLGVAFRLYPMFPGFVASVFSLLALHVGTALHAAIGNRCTPFPLRRNRLRLTFTIVFLVTTVSTFGNSRSVMGFDRVSMSVPVMAPTIFKGEQLLVDTWRYKSQTPQRGDIIIHTFDGQQGVYLNRVVAIPGDLMQISNGTVFINGIPIIEEYVDGRNATRCESREMNIVIVPMNSYFVLGDNRDRSFGDSRFSGTVPLENILGKITSILYSRKISRIGKRL